MKICSLLLFAPLLTVPAFCDTASIDCNAKASNLQLELFQSNPGDTILVTGACAGPILIAKNIRIVGNPTFSIQGGLSTNQDVIQVLGPARVTIENATVSGGVNGIHGRSGAQLYIGNVQVGNNASDGIFVERDSSASIAASSANNNGANGLHVEASSSVLLNGKLVTDSNTIFGVDVNGSSSLTIDGGRLEANNNVLGIQFGTSAAGFIANAGGTIVTQGNATTGLTIVSGAHFVAFGGRIRSNNNGGHGISVDSKAGLDLDAAALVTSTQNGGDGLHIEETSVATLFNTTAFSGAPGVTTLEVIGNQGNGISLLTGSNLTVIHQAQITSQSNAGYGIFDDNGSGLTLIQSTVKGNATKDVAVEFGSRADISQGTVIGTFTCDASAFVRGSNIPGPCPR